MTVAFEEALNEALDQQARDRGDTPCTPGTRRCDGCDSWEAGKHQGANFCGFCEQDVIESGACTVGVTPDFSCKHWTAQTD